MADYSDFDIDRSTAQAWSEFQGRLSEVISLIDDSADLRIGTESVDATAGPLVTFSSPAPSLVRSEAAGNRTLAPTFQLSPRQLREMERLGWQPPTADQPRPTDNFWAEADQEQSDRLSQLAVAALRDVYGVQHPVFLSPDHLAEVLQPAPEALEGSPERLVQAAATVPGSQEHLNDLVDEELAEIFGHRPIRDAEGDIAIRVGSTMLFLRTTPDGREVVVFAAVVHDVEGRSRAAEVLNDLNVDARWVKFMLIRDRVFATLSVPARPFVAAHLRQAVRIMSDVADGIDNELAAKLRGRTTFNETGEL